MIVVRYATLAALVVWLAAMTGARFGELVRRVDLVSYACGAATIVGLLLMKFLGPPPRGFFARIGVAALMLAVAAGSRLAPSRETAVALMTLNVALGFSLLVWYVRE
jgi:hypothetical protein